MTSQSDWSRYVFAVFINGFGFQPLRWVSRCGLAVRGLQMAKRPMVVVSCNASQRTLATRARDSIHIAEQRQEAGGLVDRIKVRRLRTAG